MKMLSLNTGSCTEHKNISVLVVPILTKQLWDITILRLSKQINHQFVEHSIILQFILLLKETENFIFTW